MGHTYEPRSTLQRLESRSRSLPEYDEIVAVVELPGMRKEDVELSLHDGILTISGERKEDGAEGDKTTHTERFVGKFRRSISLPTRVDAAKVNATYKDKFRA